MKYFYLISGKLKKGFKIPNEDNYDIGASYQWDLKTWRDMLEPCEINENEFNKIILNIEDYSLKCHKPINVTDLIDSTFDKEHGIDIYFFKEPIEKCDCGYMADENGICTECNLPKPFGNTEQVECCKRNEKGVKMCKLKCCIKSENTELDYDSRPYSEKEQIILWIAKRIRDEQRKHSYHDENWHEIAARKIYASYDIKLKTD